MAKEDFVPRADDEYDSWCDTFTTKIDEVLTDVGLPLTEADDAQAKIVTQKTKFADANTTKQLAQNKNQIYRGSRIDIEEEIRSVAKKVKAQTTYTPAIGEKAGLEGEEETADIANAKPKIKVILLGGEPMVSFNKPRFTGGVKIWSQRAKETDFTFLATDTNSPYVDNRTNVDPTTPEKRKFYAFFIDKNDKVIGLKSDVVEILVS